MSISKINLNIFFLNVLCQNNKMDIQYIIIVYVINYKGKYNNNIIMNNIFST